MFTKKLKYSESDILGVLNSESNHIAVEDMLSHIIKNGDEYRDILNKPFLLYSNDESFFSEDIYNDNGDIFTDRELQSTIMIELMSLFKSAFLSIDKYLEWLLDMADFSQPKRALKNVVSALIGDISYNTSTILIGYIKEHNIPYAVWGGRVVSSEVINSPELNIVDSQVVRWFGFGSIDLLSMSHQKYTPDLLFKTLSALSDYHSRDSIAIFTDDIKHLMATKKIEDLSNDLIKMLYLSERKDLLYTKLSLSDRLEKFNQLYSRLESLEVKGVYQHTKSLQSSGFKI